MNILFFPSKLSLGLSILVQAGGLGKKPRCLSLAHGIPAYPDPYPRRQPSPSPDDQRNEKVSPATTLDTIVDAGDPPAATNPAALPQKRPQKGGNISSSTSSLVTVGNCSTATIVPLLPKPTGKRGHQSSAKAAGNTAARGRRLQPLLQPRRHHLQPSVAEDIAATSKCSMKCPQC